MMRFALDRKDPNWISLATSSNMHWLVVSLVFASHSVDCVALLFSIVPIDSRIKDLTFPQIYIIYRNFDVTPVRCVVFCIIIY